jgi:hypothetical protein
VQKAAERTAEKARKEGEAVEKAREEAEARKEGHKTREAGRRGGDLRRFETSASFYSQV